VIWDSQRIANAIGAEHPSSPALPVQNIVFDSRQYSAGSGQVFFAFKGANHDGHQYIGDLYDKGLRLFVVENLPGPGFDEALFLRVDNSLMALQNLAKGIRQDLNPEIVSITGSNGKTIVKEWLYRLMTGQEGVYRSPKSYNSQIGVPLSIWGMLENTRLGIFEAGISMPNEMERLADILEPKGGIFTNIGSAHGANFESRKQKIREKLKLFKNAQYLIYPADQEELSKEIEDFASGHQVRLYPWSRIEGKSEAWMEVLSRSADHCQFHFKSPIGELEAQVPFGDEASIQNLANALYQAFILGQDSESLKNNLALLNPIEMRLEMKEGHQGTLLINDSYNSDLESLRVALHFLNEHGKDKPKVLILSDMQQSGIAAEKLRAEISKVVEAHELEMVFGIGPKLSNKPLSINVPSTYFYSTDEFLSHMSQYRWQGRAILLKGSRPFAFERIDQRLARQRHETVMEIHLNRLVHNLNYYRSRLKPSSLLMVMVKAFAYGAGSEEVARVLAFHGVDYLAVAYADEGVALRKAGVGTPIMVLNPENSSIDSFFDFHLEPEVYSFARLREISEMATERQHELKVHLKLETGMNRLGFNEQELPKLISDIKANPYLKVASAFSHLAASDEPQEREFTRGQIALYQKMTKVLEQGLGETFIKHIANTGAIESYPEAHFDMVRLGIGLYGIAAHPEEQSQLLTVAELKARVSQVKTLKPGDTVGYGRSWKTDRPTRIGIISIGYADGFARALSNGIGKVLIKGKLYPVVGRVCMDMCMVELGDAQIEEGDEVLIFGDGLPIHTMAKALNTITYEVLTGISDRVKRVYYMA